MVRDAEADDSLGSTDHEMLKPEILKEASETDNGTAVLHLRRGRFGLLGDLLGRFIQQTAVKGKEAQEIGVSPRGFTPGERRASVRKK